MLILKPYDQVIKSKKRYSIVKSGRDAGKSKFGGQLTTMLFMKYELNILICRSNYGDLQDSMFQEILDVLEEEHLLPFIEQRTRPLKIINKLNGNVIYFKGVGGADLSRTKGFKTSKKLSLILFDELQQLPNQSNLDQALATFRRHLDPELGKVVMFFNPEPQNSHWCNEYYRIHSEDDRYLCLHTSYKNIAKILNKVDLEAIEMEKILNPSNYKYLYLGETNGLLGGVYHTFDRDIHLLTEEEADELIKRIGIHMMVIGLDPATTRDSTAGVPVLILRNGQCMVVECFHHDPKKYGALDNSRLYPLLDRWIDDLKMKYDMNFKGTPIHIVIDSAGADLVQKLQYEMSHKYKVWSYSQKRVIQMAQVMQDAFSQNVLLIKDTNGYYNYATNRFEYGNMPLITALESVIWDEKGKGFDPMVPNDDSDALTYAVSSYFLNPYNIYFPKKLGFYERIKKGEVTV